MNKKELIKEFFNQKAKNWDKEIDKKEIKNLKKIISYIKLKEYNKVLDVGCGSGIAYKYLQKKFKKYIGIDVSNEMINISKNKFSKAKFVEGRFEEHNFKDKFDLIFVFNTFPHILNKKLFLKKAKKILTESGKIVIAHSLALKQINQIHKKTNNSIISKHIINSNMIRNLLRKANFKNIRIISKNLFYAEGSN